MPMNYSFSSSGAQITKGIEIERIVSIYLFEFSSSYKYSGESHDFWEMVYVDSGSLDIISDTTGYRLKRGDLAFHHPNEFHALSSTGENAPSIIVISFVSHSPAMKFFEKRILNIPFEQRILISDIIHEAKNVYSDKLGLLHPNKERNESVVFGSEQLLYAYLERALIIFYRSSEMSVKEIRASGVIKNKFGAEFTNSIIQYLNENVSKNLKLDDICAKFYMSKTQLKVLFKKNTGQSVISYFNQIKMDEAKKLLRHGGLKITEISSALGYGNVHYFSASFKNHFKMSPTEYCLSVKAYEETLRDK